jgi:hypothetical protein
MASDELPEYIYQERDVDGPHRAKIGTYTPTLIWINRDDLPVSEGDAIRYVTKNPADKHPEWGSERTAGRVNEIRDQAGEPLYFITEEPFLAEEAKQS